jgi:hypothetical protein
MRPTDVYRHFHRVKTRNYCVMKFVLTRL